MNGAIRYELPSNAVVRIEERTGSWKDSMEELSDEKVSGRVFEIVIPHGRRPAGASCSWRVMPSSLGIIEKMALQSFLWSRVAQLHPHNSLKSANIRHGAIVWCFESVV